MMFVLISCLGLVATLILAGVRRHRAMIIRHKRFLTKLSVHDGLYTSRINDLERDRHQVLGVNTPQAVARAVQPQAAIDQIRAARNTCREQYRREARSQS